MACSKNELTPAASVADQEITYTVAPKVKANVDFNNAYTFQSTAYYLPKAESWASHTTSLKEYINNVTVKWDDSAWRVDGKKYYWPKDGKLNFFAWTSLKATAGATVSAESYATELISEAAFDKTAGVKITNYVVTDKNVDILVADPMYDQVENLDSDKLYREGVATLFKHKLSKVLFTAKTDKDYLTAAEGGVKFTINSITFKGIDSKGSYVRLATAPAEEGWSNSDPADQNYYPSTAGQARLKMSMAKLASSITIFLRSLKKTIQLPTASRSIIL